MMKILSVRSPDDSGEVLRLSWAGGRVSIDDADPLIRGGVERWISRGLIELVREPGGGLRQRVTRSNDAEFLERVAEMLRSEFGFHTTVIAPTARTKAIRAPRSGIAMAGLASIVIHVSNTSTGQMPPVPGANRTAAVDAPVPFNFTTTAPS